MMNQTPELPAGMCIKRLSLQDNSPTTLDVGTESGLSEEQLELLRLFSDKSLKELKCDGSVKSDGLVVIGDLDAIKENTPLFELREKVARSGEVEVKTYSVQTHNTMGVFTLRHNDTQIRMQITSRFDKKEDKQRFLCWMLERVLSINLSDFVDTQKVSSLWTLLIELLFSKRLGDASSVGLYRHYQCVEYNDLRFRGKLDIDRHIKMNMPLWDKIAYSRREISYDNPVNHLLRHATRIVMSHLKDNKNVAGNKDSLDMFSYLETNTPSWMPGNLRDTLLDKEILNGINHPYYAQVYEELRLLALAIVMEHGVDVYSNANDFSINGILFDGAWLWEEYLSTMLAGMGFRHAIPMDTHPIHALRINKKNPPKRPLFPDFRLPNKGDEQLATIILDAKYKRGDKNTGLNVRRADMHQCFCYMLLTGAVAGGVIYPPFLENEADNDFEDDKKLLEIVCPETRYWRCFTFQRVDVCDDENFAARMDENEENLKTYIKDLTDAKDAVAKVKKESVIPAVPLAHQEQSSQRHRKKRDSHGL